MCMPWGIDKSHPWCQVAAQVDTSARKDGGQRAADTSRHTQYRDGSNSCRFRDQPSAGSSAIRMRCIALVTEVQDCVAALSRDATGVSAHRHLVAHATCSPTNPPTAVMSGTAITRTAGFDGASRDAADQPDPVRAACHSQRSSPKTTSSTRLPSTYAASRSRPSSLNPTVLAARIIGSLDASVSKARRCRSRTRNAYSQRTRPRQSPAPARASEASATPRRAVRWCSSMPQSDASRPRATPHRSTQGRDRPDVPP
jgi:hypothetical protein